jgi:tetratricopeptide (TPR) repeat protein
LQIDRVMVHYWLASDGPIEKLVEAISSVPAEGGAAPQLAQLFKGLVYMNMRRERYDLSPQTVSYALHRLNASRLWGNEGEILEARFMYGIGLLFAGRLEHAEQELAQALPDAEKRGDRTLHARFLAYLTVAQRRRRHAADVAALAARCIAVARLGGMNEYVGTGRANQGWVAWLEGSFADARTACETALAVWSGLSLVYPLQWLARLVLMAMDVDEGQLDRAVDHAAAVLDSKQQLLPMELAAALAAAREQPRRAIDLAITLGFL